jgi:hypothetical protein
MDSQPTEEAPWQSGLRGARANLVPGLVLQAASVALVVGYYRLAAVHDALSAVSRFRESTGFAFGIASTGLFGGLLPFLYFRSLGSASARYSWAQGASLTAFWAYKGLEVGLWYALQARIFGPGHGALTITLKVIADQFVYCPVLAVPVTTLVYQLVESRGDGRAVLADLRTPRWYRRRALPVLISNLGVWVPAVAVIYALPTLLQLPLQNIVLCFYTLVVAHQTRS